MAEVSTHCKTYRVPIIGAVGVIDYKTVKAKLDHIILDDGYEFNEMTELVFVEERNEC